MADTLGQLKWIIDVDTSTGEAKLRAFKEKVSGVGDAAETESKKANAAFTAIAKVGIAALVAATVAAAAAITKNIGAAVRRVDTLNNAPRVLENLGFSAGDSQKAIDTLDKRIRGLPTSLDEATNALLSIASASGLGIEEATDLTAAFNDMALAGGKGPAEASRALLQYTQALGRGKFFMQDFNTLAEVMPAQLNQVAKTLLGPEANVRKLGTALSTGELDISDFNKAILDLDKKGGKGFASFRDQAKDATDGIQTGFANMNTAITRGIADVIKKIGSKNITNVLSGIGKAFETGLKAVGDGLVIFGQMVGEVMKWLKPLFDYISGNKQVMEVLKTTLIVIAGILAGAVLAAIIVVTGVVAALTFVIDLLVKAFIWVGEQAIAAWNGIVGVWNGVVAFFTGIWTGIKKAFAAVGTFFKNLFSGAWNGIKAVWSVVTGFFRNIWTGIKNVFSPIINWFKSIFQRAWNGITNIWNRVGSFFGGIWRKITGAFDGVRNLGKNIIKGLWNGISDMTSWIGNKIKGFGDGVLKGIKNFFGIKSPSRVMRDQVGKMIGLGMADGITKSTKDAVRAAQTASSDVLGAFDTQSRYATTSELGGRLNTLESARSMSSQVSEGQIGLNGGSTATINQTNNFYNSDDPNMQKVNQDLKWELNKL